MNMHCVALYVASYNVGAKLMLERLGFKQEGCSREGLYRGGKYWDILQYSMLKAEFDAIMGVELPGPPGADKMVNGGGEEAREDDRQNNGGQA